MENTKDFIKQAHEERRKYKEWLDSLVEGDEVGIEYGRGRIALAKIEKITKTRRFNLDNGLTYRNDGSCFGTYTGGNMTFPTDTFKKRLKKRKMLSRVASGEFHKLKYDDIEKIYNILYPGEEVE